MPTDDYLNAIRAAREAGREVSVNFGALPSDVDGQSVLKELASGLPTQFGDAIAKASQSGKQVDLNFAELPKQQEAEDFFTRAANVALRGIQTFRGAEGAATDSVTGVGRKLISPIPGTEEALQRAGEKIDIQPLVAAQAPFLAPLAKKGGPLSAERVAPFAAPTPLDVMTFGVGAIGVRISAAAGSKVARAGVAEKLAADAPVAGVRSFEEGMQRLERAADLGKKKRKAAGIRDSVVFVPEAKGPIPDKVIGANLSKLNTTDDVKRFIADTANANRVGIDEAQRGRITLSEQKRLADQLGMSEEQLLKRRRGQAFNAEEAMASRQVLTASAEDMQAKATAVVQGGGSLGDFGRAMARHLEIQKEAAGVRAEAGRALGSFRKNVGGNIEKAIEKVLKDTNLSDVTQEMARRISKLDPQDPRAVNKFVRDMAEGTFGDQIFEAWVNALLSGPQTHIVNSVSNSLTLMTRPLLERPTRTAIDAVRSTFTGSSRERFAGEITADLWGIGSGMLDGVRNALRTIGDEIPELFDPSGALGRAEQAAREGVERFAAPAAPTRNISKIELGAGTKASIKGVKGALIRAPGTLLQAADDFFKTIARSGEVRARAYREAVKRGLKGQDRADFISSVIARKGEVAEAIWKAGDDEALYRTFTKPLGEGGRTLERLRMQYPATKIIVPFMRTPINIAKFGLERTPLNFIRVARKGLKGELAGAEMVDELAKPVMGSAIGAAAVWGAGQGLVTGGGPADPNERRVLRTAGWQPYSVRVGQKFYSYQRLEPIAMVVGLAADYAELNDFIEEEDAVGKIALAIGQNLTSKTFLRGVSDLLNAVSDPERHGQRWVERIAGTIIPTAVAGEARAQDGVFRDPQGVKQAVLARIPGFSDGVPVLRDIWGQPVQLPGTPMERRFSPIYRSEITKDKATLELAQLGYRSGSPRRTIGALEISEVEYDNYAKTAGMMAKANVDRLVNSDGWGRMDNPTKLRLIENAFSQSRRLAAIQTVPDFIKRQRKAKAEKTSRRFLKGFGETVHE